MKALNIMKNTMTSLICGLLCISAFHLNELNNHRHSEIEQRIANLNNPGIATTSIAVDANTSDQVIELPKTQGVYTNDIEANFQQGVMQTLGETIVACVLITLTYAGIKQILRIRSEDLRKEKRKA